jgi:hypothetical protein
MSIEKNALSITTFLLNAALLAASVLCAVPVVAQTPGSCATAAEPGTAIPLSLNTSVVSSKATDEWGNEVLKITVREPGLLAVSADGPEVQGLLYVEDATGPHLLDEKGIGTAGRTLALEVDPGEYCVRLEPPASVSGSVRVRAELIGLTVPDPE